MESFDFDNVKAEKANAMRRFNHLRGITVAFRALELALALGLLSWIVNSLPVAVRISGDLFWCIAGVVASPLFVFVLSNGIIVALIAKSGVKHNNAETELYEEIVKNSGAGDRKDTDAKTTSLSLSQSQSQSQSQSLEESVPRPRPYTVEEDDEEVVYQDKQIVSEVNKCLTTTAIHRSCVNDVAKPCNSDSDSDMETYNKPRAYRRSKSERLMAKRREKVLRRSETEKCGVKCGGGDFAGAEQEESLLYPEDELSDEEFQQTIEAFIAKQLKFRRQESMAIVPQNQA